MKPDQERVKSLLKDTVTLLCRNGLQFQQELKVQGLLGITLDNDEVFLVQIDERIGGLFSLSSDITSVETSQSQQSAGYRAGKQAARPSHRQRRTSRFRHRQTFSAGSQKRLQRALPLVSAELNGSQNSIVHIGERLSSDILTDQNDANVSNLEDNGRELSTLGMPVKKEEKDDDVIVVDHDEDHDEDFKLHSDRAVMLGSYATEMTKSEARNIFSEFSLLSDALGADGGTSDVINELTGRPLIGSYIANNQSVNMGDERPTLPTTTVGSMLWDVGNSRTSQSFLDSQTETTLSQKRKRNSKVDVTKRRELTLTCRHCGSYFQHSRSLKRHIAAIHEHMLNICTAPNCGRTYHYHHDLRAHIKRCHSDTADFHSSVSSDFNRPRCGICGKLYATHATLQRHLDAMHGTKRYSCEVEGCAMQFKYQHRLREHQRVAHPQQYSLDFC